MTSNPLPSKPPLDYVMRINAAIDFVLKHIDEPIRLDAVARVACFSPFHFHRVFRSLMGETLNEFVTRVRLERSLHTLSFDRSKTLTDVALAYGFESSSNYSRVFKQHFGVAPSQFDLESFRASNRDTWRKALSDNAPQYSMKKLPVGENPDAFRPVVRTMPPRLVAYTRVLDPYRAGAVTDAASRMMEWAGHNGLAAGQWLGYMWDDPEIVEHTRCRYDVGLVVADVDASGEIGRFEFPEMTVVEVEVKGDIELEQRAIDWLYTTWLPSSGFVPDEHPSFESWIGQPFEHGFEYFELHVQIPIKSVGTSS